MSNMSNDLYFPVVATVGLGVRSNLLAFCWTETKNAGLPTIFFESAVFFNPFLGGFMQKKTNDQVTFIGLHALFLATRPGEVSGCREDLQM